MGYFDKLGVRVANDNTAPRPFSEAVAEYEHDGGRTLIEDALSDAPETMGSAFESV